MTISATKRKSTTKSTTKANTVVKFYNPKFAVPYVDLDFDNCSGVAWIDREDNGIYIANDVDEIGDDGCGDDIDLSCCGSHGLIGLRKLLVNLTALVDANLLLVEK